MNEIQRILEYYKVPHAYSSKEYEIVSISFGDYLSHEITGHIISLVRFYDLNCTVSKKLVNIIP